MVYSKDKSKQIATETLDRLIDLAGSQAHLARMLTHSGFDVSPQGIQNWVQRGQISKAGALAVIRHPELGTKFILAKLRPDVSTKEWARLSNGENREEAED